MRFFGILIFPICFISACAGIRTLETKPTKHFVLSLVQKIRPGVSEKNDVLSILGKPDRNLDLSHASPIKSDSEAWSYLEEPYFAEDRITVEFPPNSNTVLSVGWEVREGETEQFLETAKARFPQATFESQHIPDINPHSAENRLFYKDRQLGIVIVYNESNNLVESISWMQPTEIEKRTALDNFQYPNFCIQEHCAHSSPEIERKLTGK